MSTWVSAAPVIGAGSLDGFAIAALMTGACALGMTASRRPRGRKRPSARDRALAAEESGWLCEHVMAAEAVGAGVTAEAAVGAGSAAFVAAPMPTSGKLPPGPTFGERPPALSSRELPQGPTSAEVPPWLTPAANASGLPSGAAEPFPPSQTPVPEFVAAAMVPGLVAEAVASALAAEAAAGKAMGGYRNRHLIGRPTSGSMPWDAAEPVFPGPQLSERAPAGPRRPEARRLPRHAAPPVSFGSRMTGLFASRALAANARG